MNKPYELVQNASPLLGIYLKAVDGITPLKVRNDSDCSEPQSSSTVIELDDESYEAGLSEKASHAPYTLSQHLREWLQSDYPSTQSYNVTHFSSK